MKQLNHRLRALWAVLLAGAFVLAGCSETTNPSGSGPSNDQPTISSDPLRIIAATELDDLGPILDHAGADLGFDIIVEAPAGTLANSQALKAGEFDGDYDATWFATNRYLDLIGGSNKLVDQESLATSPVAFGIATDKVRELGWVDEQPTWGEIAAAANNGDLTFGMTDPASSNSGFTALVSAATAFADTGVALTKDDIRRVAPQLTEFFSGQSITSGSSGWLADTFIYEPGRADAIINYESVLHTMADEGTDIMVIVPADGVISADYPLSTLAAPSQDDARQKVALLADWLGERPEIFTDSYRRPVTATDQLPRSLSETLVIELPFPGSEDVTTELLAAYNNELRAPGQTAFVLDVSGSMEGQRLASLKAILGELIDGTAQTSTGPVGLRDREHVILVPFHTYVDHITDVTFDNADPATSGQLQEGVDNLAPDGTTALFDAVQEAYAHLDEDPATISTIVVMSDGEANEGANFEMFREFHAGLSQEHQDIPVFVILYGEANEDEMTALADLTGGRVFDALDGDLAEAFKEIRGYQ